MKVAVLAGGLSLERPISLKAGSACQEALEGLGHDVTLIDVDRNLGSTLECIKPDVVFNALHGPWGEDGCVQGLLELMGLPYTHSGVLASALAMDKDAAKRIYRAAGIRTPDGVMVATAAFAEGHPLPPPYVVKPHNDGSSLGGLWLVEDETQDPPDLSSETRPYFLVEQYIPGRELSAAVLGDQPLAVSEFNIDKVYDFSGKYEQLSQNRVLPAPLPEDIYEACLDIALRAHRALGCQSLTRTDIRWDEDYGIDGLYALETNTQPGLRPNSNAAQQAAYIGIDFSSLCQWLIDDASCNRDERALLDRFGI